MKAYIDGSEKGLYGYLIRPGEKLKLVKDHPMTNNQAEWLALLTLLLDLEEETTIQVYSDSQIVVNQLKGEWETKNETLKHMKKIALMIIQTKNLNVRITWVRRNLNPFGKHLEKLLKEEKKKRKKLREKLQTRY